MRYTEERIQKDKINQFICAKVDRRHASCSRYWIWFCSTNEIGYIMMADVLCTLSLIAHFLFNHVWLRHDWYRRRPGQSRITTPRKEADACEILSGVDFSGSVEDEDEGITLGTPIAILVRNKDQRYAHSKWSTHVYMHSQQSLSVTDKKYFSMHLVTLKEWWLYWDGCGISSESCRHDLWC